MPCRPLDPLYSERWQTTEVGARGGLEVRPPFAPHVAVSAQQYFAEFNAWFARYGASATTEHLKPAASHAKKAEILRQVCREALYRMRCTACVHVSVPAFGLRCQECHCMHAAPGMRELG